MSITGRHKSKHTMRSSNAKESHGGGSSRGENSRGNTRCMPKNAQFTDIDKPRYVPKTAPPIENNKSHVGSTAKRTWTAKVLTNASSRQTQWTPKEDEALRAAVDTHNARNWKLIARALPNRTEVQCLHRWQKVLNPILVKGYWTKEEDEKMVELVEMFGTKRWAAIARSLPGRNGKQCRERWCNHLDPRIKRDAWTDGEDMMLYLAHGTFGNKWAEISKLLPGRSDNAIKNRWNTSIKKNTKVLEEFTKPLPDLSPQNNTEAGEGGNIEQYFDENYTSAFHAYSHVK